MNQLLIPTFLIITITACGQTTDQPFKKANTILIETNRKADSVFIVWGRHLAQEGYSIAKSDDKFFTITTGPKDASKFNVDFYLNSVILNNGTIKIKIKWRIKSSMLARTSAMDYSDWNYANGGGNIKYVIYQDVMKVVKSFGNYQVKYSLE